MKFIKEDKKKKLLLFLSIILIFGFEDKKENAILEADALLRWTGEFAVDGCGFFLVIEDHEYKPEDEVSIDDSFKINGGLDVVIKYELLNETIEYSCGFAEPFEINGVKLHSIEKK